MLCGKFSAYVAQLNDNLIVLFDNNRNTHALLYICNLLIFGMVLISDRTFLDSLDYLFRNLSEKLAVFPFVVCLLATFDWYFSFDAS